MEPERRISNLLCFGRGSLVIKYAQPNVNTVCVAYGVLRIRSAMHTEDHSMMYTPRYAVLLQEQVDPAHYTATHYETSIKSVHVRGVLHSVNDQPAIVRDLVYYPVMIWYAHGTLHRDNDRPAFIWRDRYTEWYRHGVRCRDGDRFASISWQYVCAEWSARGQNKPARVTWYLQWVNGRTI